jgi:hypothetical protein
LSTLQPWIPKSKEFAIAKLKELKRTHQPSPLTVDEAAAVHFYTEKKAGNEFGDAPKGQVLGCCDPARPPLKPGETPPQCWHGRPAFYAIVNTRLRELEEKTRRNIAPFLPYLFLFLKAMYKLRAASLPDPTAAKMETICRGLPDPWDKVKPPLQPNGHFVWWSISSCTGKPVRVPIISRI